MTFHSIYIFRCLVETQSYNVTAKMLLLSQPSVSAQISNLEASLGVKLIDRKQTASSKSIFLTEVGKQVYELACSILDDEKQIRKVCNQYKENLRLTLNVLTNVPIAINIIPKVLSEFAQNNSSTVKLEVKPDSVELAKLVSSVTYDICIIPTFDNVKFKDVVYRFSVPFVLVTNKSNEKKLASPLNLKRKDNIPDNLLLPTSNSATRMILNKFLNDNHISINNPIEIGNPETIKYMLQENQDYYSFLSYVNIYKQLQDNSLIRVDTIPPPPSIEYAVIIHNSKENGDQCQELLRYFKREIECILNLNEV